MRRLSEMSYEDIIKYNLRGGGNEFTVFLDTQTSRVLKARELVESCLSFSDKPATIIELGCSAGDIIGPFASTNFCTGYDVTPGAVKAAMERYSHLAVIETSVEDVAPLPCDVLILCEFLEHIVDPIGLVKAWMPLAKTVVIGHPLVGDGGDPEYGHLWAYEPKDFENWFPLGGHTMDEAYRFDMGYQMVIGRGHRS
jgi:hypothetical protein